MKEIWLPVVGFETSYEVSNKGRVRGMDRLVEAGTGRERLWRGKILKFKKLPNSDHVRVALHVNGIRKERLVHHLVLEAFVGPCPDGMEALHDDDIGNNNVLPNLSWGTRSQNMIDRIKNGRNPNSRKMKCPRGHDYDRSYPRSKGGRNHRYCGICQRAASRRSYRKSRSKI